LSGDARNNRFGVGNQCSRYHIQHGSSGYASGNSNASLNYGWKAQQFTLYNSYEVNSISFELYNATGSAFTISDLSGEILNLSGAVLGSFSINSSIGNKYNGDNTPSGTGSEEITVSGLDITLDSGTYDLALDVGSQGTKADSSPLVYNIGWGYATSYTDSGVDITDGGSIDLDYGQGTSDTGAYVNSGAGQRTFSMSGEIVPVPEPTTGALGMLGSMILLGRWGWRRFKPATKG
jgi:hypothetical protein